MAERISRLSESIVNRFYPMNEASLFRVLEHHVKNKILLFPGFLYPECSFPRKTTASLVY